MKSTTKPNEIEAEAITAIHHLVTVESQGKPLCGATSPDAVIGSYVEHLDEKQEFAREVFGKDGKPAKACNRCLSLYPPVLS
jgi:hypothetical protein